MKLFTLIEILQNETGDRPDLLDKEFQFDAEDQTLNIIQFDYEEGIWICLKTIDLKYT